MSLLPPRLCVFAPPARDHPSAQSTASHTESRIPNSFPPLRANPPQAPASLRPPRETPKNSRRGAEGKEKFLCAFFPLCAPTHRKPPRPCAPRERLPSTASHTESRIPNFKSPLSLQHRFVHVRDRLLLLREVAINSRDHVQRQRGSKQQAPDHRDAHRGAALRPSA